MLLIVTIHGMKNDRYYQDEIKINCIHGTYNQMGSRTLCVDETTITFHSEILCIEQI